VIPSSSSEIRSPKGLALLLLILEAVASSGADLSALVQDRMAVERVYYSHRLGTKPPFKQVSPEPLIERLVKQDLRKETALKQVYGVEITPRMLEAEVQRINTTTRAPEMLGEIKAALGDDPMKFAEAFAKPFLVERLLRDKFENDTVLHAARRRECEEARNQLLIAKAGGASPTGLVARLKRSHSKAVTEKTWELGERAHETNAITKDELVIKKRFGPNAQVIPPPHAADADQKFYFEDLPPPLQKVLHAQLRQPGDVSAVIETPGAFLLYICKQKSAEMLSAVVFSLPKCNYGQWLNEQAEKAK